jgi:predicted site-specific integrase-resolvase
VTKIFSEFYASGDFSLVTFFWWQQKKVTNVAPSGLRTKERKRSKICKEVQQKKVTNVPIRRRRIQSIFKFNPYGVEY